MIDFDENSYIIVKPQKSFPHSFSWQTDAVSHFAPVLEG
jgi:hypothetical protein